MSIPTTPRQPWMRATDRYVWLGTKQRFSGPLVPIWNGGRWDYYVGVLAGPETRRLSVESERRSSLCRIAPARKARPVASTPRETKPVVSTRTAKRADKARRATGKVVVRWGFVIPGEDGAWVVNSEAWAKREHGSYIMTGRMPGPIIRIEFPAPRASKGRGK